MAQKGFCKPKKVILHNTLKISWKPKKYRATLTPSLCHPFAQTIPAASPIVKYNMPHTGAKIQLGGLKLGLFSVMYQLSTEL